MVISYACRAVLLLLVFFSVVGWAGDTSVNVIGRVLSSSCEADIDPLIVNLGSYSKNELSAKGKTTAAKNFELRLKDCPVEIKQIQVQFDGPTATGDSSALLLSHDNDVARGVGVQLLDNAQKVLSPGTRSQLTAISGGSGTVNKLAFSARYIATADTVVSGSANSNTTFTIWYSH
jgi:major type 1 subunit fimbrin (pilin)